MSIKLTPAQLAKHEAAWIRECNRTAAMLPPFVMHPTMQELADALSRDASDAGRWAGVFANDMSACFDGAK